MKLESIKSRKPLEESAQLTLFLVDQLWVFDPKCHKFQLDNVI